jgi:hypothetical protein
LARDEIESEHMDSQFRGHMNRGVLLLAKRLRSLGSLSALVAP